MFGMFKRVSDLEARMDDLERRLDAIEGRVKAELDGLRGYKHKTEAELLQIKSQLEQVVGTLVALVDAAENKEGAARATALLRRARNHLTRATRHLSVVA
jgi:chromosome segregation ATPase